MLTDVLSPERLPSLVENQIEGFLHTIDELKRSLPPSGPHLFADALREVVKGVQRYFPTELNLIDDQNERLARCKKYLSFLQEMHEQYFRRLRSVDEGLVPSEVRPSLEKQVQLLFEVYSTNGQARGPGGASAISYDLRLSPFWDWNYETFGYMDLVGYLLTKLTIPDRAIAKVVMSFPRWFVFIEYPSAWARNALMVPIFIHELGHFVDWATGLEGRLGRIPFDEETFNECIAQYERSPWDKSRYAARIIAHRKCSEILKAWQTEYICDLIAIRLLGPAYFFAFGEMSILLDILRSSSPTHPPSSFRLYHQYKELKQMGYLAEISSLRVLLERANATLQGQLDEPSDLNERVVYRTLRNAIIYDGAAPDPRGPAQHQGIRRYIVGPIEGHSYDATAYERDVPIVSEKYLSQGKALGDIWQGNQQKSLDFRTIVNAAWHTYLLRSAHLFYALGASSDRQKQEALNTLNELIFKSIEAAYIFSHYQGGLPA